MSDIEEGVTARNETGGAETVPLIDLVRLLLEDRRRRDEEAAEERRHRESETDRREAEMQEQLSMIRSLVESSRPAPSEPRVGEGRSAVQDKLVLSKFSEGEDVEAYLTTFERLMTVYGIDEERWAIKLAPQLSGVHNKPMRH